MVRRTQGTTAMIPMTCTCGKTIGVKDEHAGRRIRCPQCQAKLDVPIPELAGLVATDEGTAPPPMPPAPAVAPAPAPAVGGMQPEPTRPSPRCLLGHLKSIGLAYAAGLLTMGLVWLAWPRPDVERLILGNSPEYMLAALDLQKPIPPDHERVKLDRFLLNRAQEYYSDPPRDISWEVTYLAQILNEDGHASDLFGILHASIECAKKAKEREGLMWKPIGYRSFASIYETFRRAGMSHEAAVRRIDDYEKI